MWQYFTVVPDFKSTGVKNGIRSFEWPAIIRAVNTKDAMSATIEEIPYELLHKITARMFFYVLTGAWMSSVLVELGYLTNLKEAARLDSDEYLTVMSRGLVNGIMAYKKKLERYSG